jgi:hypothetical protein
MYNCEGILYLLSQQLNIECKYLHLIGGSGNGNDVQKAVTTTIPALPSTPSLSSSTSTSTSTPSSSSRKVIDSMEPIVNYIGGCDNSDGC